jgi:hypothetical protein
VIVIPKRPPKAFAFHPEKFLISLSDNVAENGSEKLGQISTALGKSRPASPVD